MLKNYLLVALKYIRKQKLFSLINILGLTVGIACCLMIFLFVMNEFSYDNFHTKGKNIYRVLRVGNINGSIAGVPFVSAPYASALLNDYPDMVKQAVRVMRDNDLITYKTASFNEKKLYIVDSNFFQLFDFHLLKGDPATVLKDANSIVLTASAAKKYFGNEDPIGKMVQMNQKTPLTVTGIAEDVPVNSHLDFDMIIPTTMFRKERWFNQWPNNGLYVYILLNPAVKPAQLTAQLPAFMNKYMGKYFDDNGFHMDLDIQPLSQIYFGGSNNFDNVKHGNLKMVYIFMSVAILILIIACINFMNLATARATDRSREVGLRKVLGAMRKQLAAQFILESLLFATVAAILALGLVQLLLPAYTHFLGYQLPVYFSSPRLYIFIIAVILVVGLLAGSYPALLMSSFSPIESLKGKLRVGRGGAFFRKTLVVFQFSISVLLIIGITIMTSQMHYVKNEDLGFSKEQTMMVQVDNGDIWKNAIVFKNALMANPEVESVSLMSGEPGGFHDSYGFETEGKPDEKPQFNTEFADFEFVKTLGLKIIAGRDLSPQYKTDSMGSVLINRSAATKLGYSPEQAVGKWVRNLKADSLPRTIVGVVEDYHFRSLKDPIMPMVISTNRDWRLFLIKLKTNHLQSAVETVKKQYASLVPAYPFEYKFLNDTFDKLYKAETTQETVLSIFSFIAILIACLGLLGLASYTAVKRTKEIGVRKVLGSSVRRIVVLLSKDLLKPVLLGTLIAIPVGYYMMYKWLQQFSYRISIHWWMFVVAAAIAIAIAVLTVSLQAIKAAIANPVKSLRAE